MQITKAEFKCSSERISQVPKDDLKDIAFIGRSNVGKSSLINMLTARTGLAKVSGTPGKTRLINHFRINDAWYLVDLPGYGYAKVSKGEKRGWSNLIGGYLEDDRRDLELVIQLIDMRHAPSRDDLQMINFLIERELPFIIVFTKSDKLNKREREERMAAFAEEIPYFEDITCVPFSAVTLEGVEQLRGIIEEVSEDYADFLENGALLDDADDIDGEEEDTSDTSEEPAQQENTGIDAAGYLIPKNRK